MVRGRVTSASDARSSPATRGPSRARAAFPFNSRSWFEVEDRGPGIAPEDHHRVFERFERLVATNKVSGLGLGLHISRHIVEAHGGTIRVRSAVGEGASFIVELPISGPPE